jgi:hypothetical protein
MLFAFLFTGYVRHQSVSVAAERIMPEFGLTQGDLGWLIAAFVPHLLCVRFVSRVGQ